MTVTINGNSGGTAVTDITAQQIPFTQTGTGAVSRTIQSKLKDVVSVKDFGADPTGIVNSYTAFANAIATLPASGGKIVVGDGTYLLNGDVSILYRGIKSIFWDISPSAIFTGTGTSYAGITGGGNTYFPNMESNRGQLAVGPYMYSCSPIPTPMFNGIMGGTATLSVEMIQPSTYVGQSVGIYAGAKGSSPNPDSNVWAANLLLTADPGAGGVYQGVEIDINCYSTTALVKGIAISGLGTAAPDVAIEITRGGVDWGKGIHILSSTIGVLIQNATTGIKLGNGTTFPDTQFCAQSSSTTEAPIVLQRNTDTTPTGNFLRCVNTANTVSIFKIGDRGQVDIVSDGNGDNIINIRRATDTSPTGMFIRCANNTDATALFSVSTAGNLTAANIDASGHCIGSSYVLGGNLRANVGAVAVAEGSIGFGGTTATTATAGGIATLPATALGYLIAYVGATQVKIPYYSA